MIGTGRPEVVSASYRSMVEDRSPVPYPVARVLIGNGGVGAPAAFLSPHADDADDRHAPEAPEKLGVDLRGFQLRGAKAHRGRRPAGNKRDRAEILIPRDTRAPTALPPIQQPALLAAYDDELSVEHGC